MTEKIISNDEIKLRLGISGSNQDSLIEVLNRQATSELWGMIGVESLIYRQITNERVEVFNSEYWIPRVSPIDLTQDVTLADYSGNTIDLFTFGQDAQDYRRVNFLNSSGKRTVCGYNCFWASYYGGYTTKQTVQVIDYNSLHSLTITAYVNGVATEWTFVASGATGNQINAETSDEVTAQNIATALVGTASGDTVTLPLGTVIELGTATDSQLTITDPTMPDELKNSVALFVSGSIAERQKVKGISSYQIGSKRVSFATNSDADFVQKTVEKYISRYRDIGVYPA